MWPSSCSLCSFLSLSSTSNCQRVQPCLYPFGIIYRLIFFNNFSCFLVSADLCFIVHLMSVYSVSVVNHLFLHFKMFFDSDSVWISFEMWWFILQFFRVHFILRLIMYIWAVAILDFDLYCLGFYTKQIWEKICYTFMYKKLEGIKIQLERKTIPSVIHHRQNPLESTGMQCLNI
jgi:hypothetical protein